jgi:hypothetical protein
MWLALFYRIKINLLLRHNNFFLFYVQLKIMNQQLRLHAIRLMDDHWPWTESDYGESNPDLFWDNVLDIYQTQRNRKHEEGSHLHSHRRGNLKS